jgi:hypothetical protein
VRYSLKDPGKIVGHRSHIQIDINEMSDVTEYKRRHIPAYFLHHNRSDYPTYDLPKEIP